MLRKALLAAAIVVGASLAMAPDDAEARRYYRGYRVYRAPARVSVGYGPRYYAPSRYYAPRFYSSRYYGPSYGRSYYRGYGGGGVSVGPGGIFVGW